MKKLLTTCPETVDHYKFIGTLNADSTTYFLAGAPEGVNVGIPYMAANGTADVEFGIEQTLVDTLQTPVLYTLTVAVGNIASGTTGSTFFDLDGYNGYRIELRAGATVLAADDNTLTIAEGEFEISTVVFDSTGVDGALLGTPLTIRLIHLNLVDPAFPTSDRETDFDDVQLDATALPVIDNPPSAAPLLSIFSLSALGILFGALGVSRIFAT